MRSHLGRSSDSHPSVIDWRKDCPPADVPRTRGSFACVIAIPARDEEAMIARCLHALAVQDTRTPFAVVLFINNSRDETATLVKSLAPQLSFPLFVHQADIPPQQANAAWARKLVLNSAAGLAAPAGLLLSTDADSYAAPDWISACEDEFAQGADVVCGFVAPDFVDAPALDFDTLCQGALEFQYAQLVAELVALVDPDADDPWPHHTLDSGANLGCRVDVLAAVGGIAPVYPGEDKAFVRLARRHGYRVRHAFKPHVTTSSRILGRALGGWSADLKARATKTRGECFDTLEPVAHVLRRTLLKVRMRRVYGTVDFHRQASRLITDPSDLAGPLHGFADAWCKLADLSPLLRHRPLSRSALIVNLERARAIFLDLRTRASAQEVAPPVSI